MTAMKVGKLTMADLGKRITLSNEQGGFLSGKYTSLEFQWAEPFMGEVRIVNGLRMTIGGWKAVVTTDTDIEVIA